MISNLRRIKKLEELMEYSIIRQHEGVRNPLYTKDDFHKEDILYKSLSRERKYLISKVKENLDGNRI